MTAGSWCARRGPWLHHSHARCQQISQRFPDGQTHRAAVIAAGAKEILRMPSRGASWQVNWVQQTCLANATHELGERPNADYGKRYIFPTEISGIRQSPAGLQG